MRGGIHGERSSSAAGEKSVGMTTHAITSSTNTFSSGTIHTPLSTTASSDSGNAMSTSRAMTRPSPPKMPPRTSQASTKSSTARISSTTCSAASPAIASAKPFTSMNTSTAPARARAAGPATPQRANRCSTSDHSAIATNPHKKISGIGPPSRSGCVCSVWPNRRATRGTWARLVAREGRPGATRGCHVGCQPRRMLASAGFSRARRR